MKKLNKNYHHCGPTKKTRDMLEKAAGLFMEGKTIPEIAKLLETTPNAVGDWRTRYRELWDLACAKVITLIINEVRSKAGTDAILEAPDRYMAMASRAEKWLDKRGEKLFPHGEETTLTKFFQDYYLPNCLFDATPRTIEQYNVVLRGWALVTGNPSVSKITDHLLAKFRDCCLKMRGLKPHLRQRPNSVRTKLRMIQTLLDRCGPRGPRRRESVGLIQDVPWARPPREEILLPKTVSNESINALYEAAVGMNVPRNPKIKAPVWWRALIVVAFNTGLRRGSLFSMQWSEVDWEGKRIVLPAKRMKSKRPMIVHLNETAIKYLRSINTGEGEVFPWPHTRRHFYRQLIKLHKLAGIPESKMIGLHAFRKTLATCLYETSPSAAQFAMGHTRGDVTRRHYVDGGPLVARALDAMTQPEAF